ncbi:hypothetical protein JMJ77_0002567 [Colletotrichum scovillei]|uniref:Uncharacterized protein n=1 Tax=Colletotrichum scovillei TaxID=1209932 RepID=A0A9P7RAZ5_9PEZI|nr:hypothetical protein JMJ77_0002567 [Colletotrichum scovillei]KAG7070990.1 hypothetical protein JMJ76_0002230 [Colletotrichum scovillei]KAG7079263.1 hypothetical protein JMJ78_0002919 [Colletotrichum scovillei]
MSRSFSGRLLLNLSFHLPRDGSAKSKFPNHTPIESTKFFAAGRLDTGSRDWIKSRVPIACVESE